MSNTNVQPLISLIVVNYNGLPFLKKLLGSMLSQTYSQCEIICVDCGSTDRSVEYIQSHAPTVRIVTCKNRGFGYGANRGAEKARGTYCMFFNSDMYIPRTFVAHMYKRFMIDQSKFGSKLVLGCKIIPFATQPKDTEPYYGGTFDLLGFPTNAKNHNETLMINGNPFFINRKQFLRAKGFNELIFLYGEDADLSWRLYLLGYTLRIDNTTWIAHYGSASVGKELSARKMSYVLFGTFLPLIMNYGTGMYVGILFFYIPFFIALNITLLIYSRFNFAYNRALWNMYMVVFRRWNYATQLRTWVQENRQRSEWEVLHKLRIIPSVLVNGLRRR